MANETHRRLAIVGQPVRKQKPEVRVRNWDETFVGFETRHADDSIFEALGEAMVQRLSRNGEFNRDRQMLMDFQERMLRIFRENPVVQVPGEFLYIGRVMGLLGGLGKQLGSQINLLEVLGSQLPPGVQTAP